MHNYADFSAPFSGFAGATFINCFASCYVVIENLLPSATEYLCNKKLTGKCNNCGNCRNTPEGAQEKYFMLFDMVCGRSALRCRFDGARTASEIMICERDFYDGGTENNIEFLFGFTGYDYSVYDNCDIAAIDESLKRDKPVIAKVNHGESRFRVIIGRTANTLLSPDYRNAQNPPEREFSVNEVDKLYVFGEKRVPKYSFKDGLLRAKSVMAENLREKVWDKYCEMIGIYTANSIKNATVNEKAKRMKRIAETMWHTFNAHNFAEVFRYAYHDSLKDSRFDEIRNKIGMTYGYTHDLAWALIGFEENVDWSKYYADYFGEMLELTISQIAKNDEAVYEAVAQLIELYD